MPAQSEVTICNLAMTMLSTSRFLSLTNPEDENAKKCNAVYSYLRDDMLVSYNWGFATAEVELAEITEESPVLANWSKVYQIPTDCLRIIEQDGQYDYKRHEDKIYSNESTCKISYIKRITDPLKFPAYFAKALSADIAATLAYGITQNATQAEIMSKRAILALKNAVWSEAQEGIGTKPIRGSFITARQT